MILYKAVKNCIITDKDRQRENVKHNSKCTFRSDKDFAV